MELLLVCVSGICCVTFGKDMDLPLDYPTDIELPAKLCLDLFIFD